MEYKTTEFGLILKDAVTACKSNFIQEIAANDYLAHTYGITVQNLLTIFEFHQFLTAAKTAFPEAIDRFMYPIYCS